MHRKVVLNRLAQPQRAERIPGGLETLGHDSQTILPGKEAAFVANCIPPSLITNFLKRARGS